MFVLLQHCSVDVKIYLYHTRDSTGYLIYLKHIFSHPILNTFYDKGVAGLCIQVHFIVVCANYILKAHQV